MFGRTKKDGGRNLKYYKKSELVVAHRCDTYNGVDEIRRFLPYGADVRVENRETVVVDGCVVKYGDFIVMKEFGTDFRTGWSKWNNWNGM